MDCEPTNAKEPENVPAPGEFHVNNPLSKDLPLADLLGMALESRIDLNTLRESILCMLPKGKSKHHFTPGIRWLTSAQAMKLLNISRTTIKRYRKNRMVRFIDFHGQYRYRLDDLEELCNQLNPVYDEIDDPDFEDLTTDASNYDNPTPDNSIIDNSTTDNSIIDDSNNDNTGNDDSMIPNDIF